MKNKVEICIIGSGIGGGILAKQLVSRYNKEVLLIEAGNTKPDNDSVKNESIGIPFGLRATTSIQLGGTSNLWHGVLSKLDEIDFIQRDWIPKSGWPISLDDLEPFYKEASEIFGVSNFEFFEKERLNERLKSKLDDIHYNKEVLENKLFQQPLPALRLKKTLNELEIECDNFEVLKDTTALELILENDRIVKVITGKRDGSLEEISADVFIVCAGALETPRILLNSNFSNQNIGKYLMDHPMGNLCQMEFLKPHKAHLYSDMKYNPSNKIKTGLIFTESIQRKLKLLNHNFYLRPSFKKGINDESEKIKLAFLTFLSGKIYSKDVVNLVKNFNVIRQILAYKFTLNFTYRYSDLFFVTEQVPNSNSKVSLSNIKDKWNYPIAKVDWQLTKQDYDSMYESFRLLRDNCFNGEDYSFVHTEEDIVWEKIFTSAAHHVGTARMSEFEKDGVVDENLKVHGSKNLYVCDGSVFTTSGNVNSGFTIGALACRLANFLNNNDL